MTNIGNELGQVLNSVLTTGEGAGIDDLCQGVVRRYRDAGEPEPDAIYVDRDCCSESGVLPSICAVSYEFNMFDKQFQQDINAIGNWKQSEFCICIYGEFFL